MTDENITPPPPPAAPTPPSAPSFDKTDQSAPAAPAYTQAQYGAPTPKVLSIVGMILGILGAFSSLFGGWGILFSIAAVVLGFLGRKREPGARGFWLTSIIVGFVGIFIALIWGIVWIFIIGYALSHGSDYRYGY